MPIVRGFVFCEHLISIRTKIFMEIFSTVNSADKNIARPRKHFHKYKFWDLYQFGIGRQQNINISLLSDSGGKSIHSFTLLSCIYSFIFESLISLFLRFSRIFNLFLAQSDFSFDWPFISKGKFDFLCLPENCENVLVKLKVSKILEIAVHILIMHSWTWAELMQL